MKTIGSLSMLVMAASLIFNTSCSADGEMQNGTDDGRIILNVSEETLSRISLAEENNTVVANWEKNDFLSVWPRPDAVGTTGYADVKDVYEFSLISGVGTKSAVFAGNIGSTPEYINAIYRKNIIKDAIRERETDLAFQCDATEQLLTSDINKAPQDINTENVVTQDIVNPQDIEKIPEISEKINQKSYTKIIKNKLSFFKPYYYVICDNFTLFITLAIALIGIILLIAISKSKKKGTSKTMNCEQPSENEKKSSIENLTKEINETYKTGLEEELSNKAEQEAQAFKDEFKDLMEQNEQQKAPEPVKEDEQYEEPQVISSVEIAPMRGFMIIETQGVKALFGYIHDDVFLLYQFREFISNYDIKYRISEKQIDKTFFIVKIDKFKLLIKVTNTSMRLELEM